MNVPNATHTRPAITLRSRALPSKESTSDGPAAPATTADAVTLSPSKPDTGVVASGATLQKLSGDFSFAEGLTCDKQGNVYFTDQPNNKIMKYSVDGQLTTFMEPAGRANGMTFSPDGNLIACADEKNELWSIKPDGQVETLAKGFEGAAFNGPNDVWNVQDQGLYFTDPFYDRTYWDQHQQPQSTQQVYRLGADGKSLERVTDDLVKPNGIVGSADGKTLYVSDIGADKTYAYDVEPNGKLDHKRLACEMGSDGMTVDNQGNLYLTGNGVTVFDKEGKKIDHIDVPEDWTGNLAFGGEDKQTLFIAASKGLYSIRTRYPGANSAK